MMYKRKENTIRSRPERVLSKRCTRLSRDEREGGISKTQKYKSCHLVTWQVEQVKGRWSKQTNWGLARSVKRGGAALTVCASCRTRREVPDSRWGMMIEGWRL